MSPCYTGVDHRTLEILRRPCLSEAFIWLYSWGQRLLQLDRVRELLRSVIPDNDVCVKARLDLSDSVAQTKKLSRSGRDACKRCMIREAIAICFRSLEDDVL